MAPQWQRDCRGAVRHACDRLSQAGGSGHLRGPAERWVPDLWSTGRFARRGGPRPAASGHHAPYGGHSVHPVRGRREHRAPLVSMVPQRRHLGGCHFGDVERDESGLAQPRHLHRAGEFGLGGGGEQPCTGAAATAGHGNAAGFRHCGAGVCVPDHGERRRHLLFCKRPSGRPLGQHNCRLYHGHPRQRRNHQRHHRPGKRRRQRNRLVAD